MSGKKLEQVRTLVLATTNPGKVVELRELLRDSGFATKTLDDFPPMEAVEETGKTFFENALLKAKKTFAHTKTPVLAEDSGLVVPALGGEPGIFSARYAGEGCSAADCIEKLLRHMQHLPRKEQRQAYFHATCVLYWEVNGEPSHLSSEGQVDGHIAFEPSGTQGFGYDPIFVPEGFWEAEKTFAVLGTTFKAKRSHRARAVEAMLARLRGHRTT